MVSQAVFIDYACLVDVVAVCSKGENLKELTLQILAMIAILLNAGKRN